MGPLLLPPYTVGVGAELPLYATSYIEGLRHRYTGFVLRGEGKTRVNTVPAYAVAYTARIAGRTVYGRDILLVPERPGARAGVHIVMLSLRGQPAGDLAAAGRHHRGARTAARDVYVRLDLWTDGLNAHP